MEPHDAALQYRAATCICRVLGVTGPKAVEVETRLDLVQTVVYAIIEKRPEATSHHTAGFSTCFGQARLKQQPEVSLHAGSERPRLVRCLDQHTAARTVAEIRQRCLCGRCLLS